MLGTLPRRHERQFVGAGSPPPSYLQDVRSGATLFLLAAVGILAALALADALRKDDAQPAAGPAAASATTTRPKRPTLLDTLSPARRSQASSSTRTRTAGSLAAPPAHGRRRRPKRSRRGRLPVPLPRDRRTARLRALEPGRQARVSRRRDRLRRPSPPHARGSVRAAPGTPMSFGYDRSIPLHPASTTWRALG